MRTRLLNFFRLRFSERTRTLIKAGMSLFLYGWALLIIIVPLFLLKLLKLIPFGGKNFVGTPIIRYYWKKFLLKNLKDFQGDAAEIDSKFNIEQFGEHNLVVNGAGLRSASSIDIAASGSEDYVADLSRCWNISCGQFDLLLVQFTYHMILRDMDALYHSIRILKSGGVLLCNFPAMSGYFPNGLSYKGYTNYIYRWYAPSLVKEMLEALGLTDQDYVLEVNGNWLARILYSGFYIPKEVVPRFLLKDDPACPILISVRIRKPEDWKVVYRPDLEEFHME